MNLNTLNRLNITKFDILKPEIMKQIFFLIILSFYTFSGFSQAQESKEDTYQTIYEIVISKDGEIKHIVKQGAEISGEIDGESAFGIWIFSGYPDKVKVISRKGEELGVMELNKQNPLRIVTPQPKSGMRFGVGVGPVGVATGGGSGLQSFNMEKYTAEIRERLETKEEKIKREYYEKKEQERLAKEAAKKAKKEAKKNKKK